LLPLLLQVLLLMLLPLLLQVLLPTLLQVLLPMLQLMRALRAQSPLQLSLLHRLLSRHLLRRLSLRPLRRWRPTRHRIRRLLW
jgi:hypothetical protein